MIAKKPKKIPARITLTIEPAAEQKARLLASYSGLSVSAYFEKLLSKNTGQNPTGISFENGNGRVARLMKTGKQAHPTPLPHK